MLVFLGFLADELQAERAVLLAPQCNALGVDTHPCGKHPVTFLRAVRLRHNRDYLSYTGICRFYRFGNSNVTKENFNQENNSEIDGTTPVSREDGGERAILSVGLWQHECKSAWWIDRYGPTTSAQHAGRRHD